MYYEFEDVYYAIRYFNTKEKPENTQQVKNSLDFGFIKYLYIYIFRYFCAFDNEDNTMIQ